MRIQLLGGFSLERDGVVVRDWRRHIAGTLLARLLTAERYRLPRDVAAQDLSPDADTETAREVLAGALHALRRIMDPSLRARGQSRYVELEGGWLVLRIGPEDWVDVAAFEHLIAEAERSADPMPLLQEAAQVYQGDLLPDEQGLWSSAPREALRQRRHRLLLWLSELQAQNRLYDQAAESLMKLLASDSAHEEAACRLMALLERQGRRVEALRVYAALKIALRREVGAQPEPETEAIAAALRAGEPAPRRRSVPPTTAPVGPPASRPLRPLIGRVGELDHIRQALMATRDGTPRSLLLAGEAGIGKTRLLDEGALLATMLGFTVLKGVAAESEQGLPHALLVQLLESPIRNRSPKALRRELRGAEALVSIIPELGPLMSIAGPPTLDTPAAERLRLWTAVRTFLVAISESRPLLLVLDDLHWADEASLGVLAFFLRRTGKARVAVLGTLRDETEADRPLQLLVQEGLREHTLHVAQVTGLASAEVGALAQQQLGTELPSSQVEALHARSGGNPFFVTELLELSRDMAGTPSRDDQGFGGNVFPIADGLLPNTVRQTLAKRLDRLDIRCRSLLRAAAVIGERFTADLLAQVAAETPDTCEDMLDVAIALGLVQESADVVIGYEWVHALMRQALYEELLPGQRRRLHTQVAMALLKRRSPGHEPNAEQMAYHLSRTHEHALAAEWLERAGDHALAVLAHPVASRHFGAARERLAVLDDLEPARMLARARIEEKLGDLRLLDGRFAAAGAHYATARELEVDVTHRAELWRKEGTTWERRGDYDRALAAFAVAFEEADRAQVVLPKSVEAVLVLCRGEVYYRQGNLGQARENALRSEELLPVSSPDPAVGRVFNLLGSIALFEGDYDEAGRCYNQTLALRRQHREGSRDEQGIANTLNNLGLVAWYRGDLKGALAHLTQSLTIKERLRDQPGTAVSLYNLGEVLTDQGSFAAGNTNCRRARQMARRLGYSEVEALAAVGQARANPARRRLRLVDALLARVHSLAATYDSGKTLVYSAIVTAEVLLRREQYAEAHDVLRNAYEQALIGPLPRQLAMIERLLGRCAFGRRLQSEAVDRLRAALRRFDDLHSEIEASRTRVVLAQVLLAGTDQSPDAGREAHALLRDAGAAFAALGAEADVQEVRQLLADAITC